ncbi:MAG: peptide chain release factor 2 [Actinomycetota bacterium]|nr:peptide chain release factor 2 [Actinomycetota bacterium]
MTAALHTGKGRSLSATEPAPRASPAPPVRVPSHSVGTTDPGEELKELDQTLRSIETVLDLDSMRRALDDLNEQAAAPDLWDDQERAQKVTSKLSYVQGDLNRVEGLRRRLDDLSVLFELAADEADEATRLEAEQELAAMRKAIGELEVRTLLSGEYDSREALVTIRAEAGGVDAADFAEMLMRMYLRWAERHGYPTEVYDTSYAEEAGLKSATFAVQVPYAYGTLSVEQGTHRLVRISPFDNQGRRQTSFAGVEVVPVVEQSDHIDIPDDEIRVDVYRSSGPGGQGVNTTDSAVRLTHLPTGIVVSCQNERSQLQNRASAMTVLQAKLLARQHEEQQAKMDALKGDSAGSWGNQMRSYVLHPYQMVKDLRTGYETGNTAGVLDGDIDEFIEAGIRWRKQAEKVA